ncbi:hypothetical protein ERJ75_001123800 [Trypanosoma vivax]|nr:hypothetical protein ERJ75_001123800 [Trypanosoma vivax]
MPANTLTSEDHRDAGLAMQLGRHRGKTNTPRRARKREALAGSRSLGKRGQQPAVNRLEPAKEKERTASRGTHRQLGLTGRFGSFAKQKTIVADSARTNTMTRTQACQPRKSYMLGLAF